MNRHHPPHRRLPLVPTLKDSAMALPRVWSGTWGALVLWCGMATAAAVVPDGAFGAALWVLAWALGVIATAAVARVALTADGIGAKGLGLGPAGLQAEWTELRLVGSGLLCLLFLSMILSLIVLTLLALVGIAELDVEAIRARDWASVGPAWKLVVLFVVGAGALAIPVMLAARLAMFVPATVAQRRMVSLPAMVISRGNVLPLVVGLSLTCVPGLAALIVGEVAAILILTLVQMPLSVIFLCSTYRRLEGRDAGG